MSDDERNRRQYERRQLNAEVRFITHSDLEAMGDLKDISESGLFMATDTDAKIGDRIIAYPKGLGRLEGVIVRKTGEGVAVHFDISNEQRKHLEKRINSALTGMPYLRLVDKRGHKRTPLKIDTTAQVEAGGGSFPCQIVDISHSGASIRSDRRLQVGVMVQIGMLQGRVCRETEEGFALEFCKPEASDDTAAA